MPITTPQHSAHITPHHHKISIPCPTRSHLIRSRSTLALLLGITLLLTILLTWSPPAHGAMLDRFDSTFFRNEDYPGEGLYDISLQFSHNPNRESTPQFISFWIQPPKGSIVTHVFVKTIADIRPILAIGATEGMYYKADTTLKSTWYHAPVYIRVDFNGIQLTEDPEPWKFSALLCSDRVNCYPEVKDKTVFIYTELVQFPKYSSSSPQYLTRWDLPNRGDEDINPDDFHPNSLFEVILTDAFTGVTDLSIFSTNPDPSVKEQIDFFDLKFVGYFSFSTSITERPIKNICFLNSIPVDVKPMGGAGRALRVYLATVLTSNGKSTDESASQIDVNRRNRLLFSCNQNLVIKTDWQSGPYAYSVIKLGHRRETTSQTYEDIVYPHLFYRELSPSYSNTSPLPPPEVREVKTELNLGLGLLIQSFVLNFKRRTSHVLVPNNGIDPALPSDVAWDTRQYLLPNTNFTIRTVLEDILFDVPLEYGVNEKRSKLSKNGFAAIFIAPVTPVATTPDPAQSQFSLPNPTSSDQHQSVRSTLDPQPTSLCDQALFPAIDSRGDPIGPKAYGTSYTYTELQYEIPSGSPLLTFEFLSNQTGSPSSDSKSHSGTWTQGAADTTPFFRSSPVSPYRNYQDCARGELLDNYPVQVYQLMYLPNTTFCSRFPVWMTRIQLESRQKELFSDSEFRPVPSWFTQFHLSAYFNIDKLPGLEERLNFDGCVDVAPTVANVSGEDDPARSIEMYVASAEASKALVEGKYEPDVHLVEKSKSSTTNLHQLNLSGDGVNDELYQRDNDDNDDDSFFAFMTRTFAEITTHGLSLDWWVQGWSELMVATYGDEYELDTREDATATTTTSALPQEPKPTPDVQNTHNILDLSPGEHVQGLLNQQIDPAQFPLFAEWQRQQLQRARANGGDVVIDGITTGEGDVKLASLGPAMANSFPTQSLPTLSNQPQSQQHENRKQQELANDQQQDDPEMGLFQSIVNDWSILWESAALGTPLDWVFIPDHDAIISNANDITASQQYQRQLQQFQPLQLAYSTLSAFNQFNPLASVLPTDSVCGEPLHNHTVAKLTVYAANVSGRGISFEINSVRCNLSRISSAGHRELLFDSIDISFPYGKAEWTTTESRSEANVSVKTVGGQFESAGGALLSRPKTSQSTDLNLSGMPHHFSPKYDPNPTNRPLHSNLHTLQSIFDSLMTPLDSPASNSLRPRIQVMCSASYDSGNGFRESSSTIGWIYPQENLIKLDSLPIPVSLASTTIFGIKVNCPSVSWAVRQDRSGGGKKNDNTCFYFHSSSGVGSEQSGTGKSTDTPQQLQTLANSNNNQQSISALTSLLLSPFAPTDSTPPTPVPIPSTVSGNSLKHTQCGVIFDYLQQGHAKFRVDLSVGDSNSMLFFAQSRTLGSWQNISPTRGIRYVSLVLPVMAGLVLITIACSFWSRRFDQLRTSRRAEKLAIELESMESDGSDDDNGDTGGQPVSLDDHGQPIQNHGEVLKKRKKKKSSRVQALLAQLHAAEGVNYYDSDDSDNGQRGDGGDGESQDYDFIDYQKEQEETRLEQEKKELEERQKSRQIMASDEDEIKPQRTQVQPTADRAKQARWAAIEAAKAQHEAQKRLREQQQQELDQDDAQLP